MKLIIGLGNPGEKYKNNRHNVGYFLIEKLQSLKNKDFRAVKTNTFMNESGEVVRRFVDKYQVDLDDLYIVYDDLDIPLGQYKIQFGKGPKDHKGVNSIDKVLGTKDFWHVRIGVDNRSPNRALGEEYVLQDFLDEEREIINKVINEVCKKLATS